MLSTGTPVLACGTPPHFAHTYFPAIDGLRAIAILLVVAFHAGVPHVGGGFIGVDVFFVLSGFLITGLLAREIENTGRIDLLDFYARRARRLLPALTLVLIATLIAGSVLLVPVGEQQNLAKSAIAASGFLANIFFWRTQSSYFAGPSEEIPLLHLWTLSVEEQFYIVWPLALIAIAAITHRRAGWTRRAIVVALTLASIASLAACVWFTPSRQALTFYTVPFRAWEFGAGALLAFVPFAAHGRALDLCGAALVISGLAAVIGSAFLFDSGTTFPGVAAALPVLGTAAAIAGVRGSPDAWPARALASLPMVTIGKLSYSWYLWHWPLLALGRANAMGEHSASRDALLVLLALALSAATFRWVEEPARRSKIGPFAGAVSSVVAGLVLMLASASLAGFVWGRAEQRVAGDSLLRAADRALSEKVEIPLGCTHFRLPFAGLAPAENCTTGPIDGNPSLMLWGDSHAHHYLPGLRAGSQNAGARVVPRTMGACKPHVEDVPTDLPGNVKGAARSCVEFNMAVLASLPSLRASGFNVVAIAARWSVPSELQYGLGNWAQPLEQRVREIRAAGLRVVLLAETPRPRHATPVCVARRGADACARSRTDVDAERAAALAVLRKLADAIDGVSVFDPVDAICTQDRCPVVHDGVVLYSDHSHLSVAGSRLLALSLAKALTPGFRTGR